MSARRPESTTLSGDCRAQLSELFAYLDGELSPARCRVIERHLKDCRCCGTLADGLRDAIAACRARGRQRVPAPVHRKARAAARALMSSRKMNG
jgi:anti-sigma factor RsiW